jgi:hypothetical protein
MAAKLSLHMRPKTAAGLATLVLEVNQNAALRRVKAPSGVPIGAPTGARTSAPRVAHRVGTSQAPLRWVTLHLGVIARPHLRHRGVVFRQPGLLLFWRVLLRNGFWRVVGANEAQMKRRSVA